MIIFRKNGKECIVGYFESTIVHLPSIGSVITVKHIGYYQNGTLRHAFYWRERPDIPVSTFPQKQILVHCKILSFYSMLHSMAKLTGTIGRIKENSSVIWVNHLG